MHRFFLSPEHITDTTVSFPQDVSHQIHHVLRLQPADPVIVLDNCGGEYAVCLEGPFGKQVSGKVLEKRTATGEPQVKLTLLLCLSQREKFEWILQKCTELGASEFVLVISSRSLVRSGKDFAPKLARWQRILTEAAEQSGRGRIPTLHAPLKLDEALRIASSNPGLRLIPHVGEYTQSLGPLLDEEAKMGIPPQVTALIGPEGGFSTAEVERAVQAGFIPVTLGPRVLRMETAAITLDTLVMSHLGQMD